MVGEKVRIYRNSIVAWEGNSTYDGIGRCAPLIDADVPKVVKGE